jgi:flavin-binding protein dodecin
MPGHVYRITEVVGTSEVSIAEAVQNAVRRASQTLKGLEWFEVSDTRGTIADGRVNELQVTVRIGFRLLSDDELKA